MISALTGQLQSVAETSVSLRSGPFVFDLLVPAADVENLRAQVGQDKLIGFLRSDDKAFFNLFTTVKGIGPKTALRALSAPVGEIAQAIESKDNRQLVALNGIGKRTAELIIAELAGKVQKFATAHVGATVAGHNGNARHTANEEDAIAAMTALGERRPDAERLLERVKQQSPNPKTTDALLREMLRMRGGK
jgi:Holliday junction DNA helicase RuvA